MKKGLRGVRRWISNTGAAQQPLRDREQGVDGITLFGLLAVSAMLVFYVLEDRSPWKNLALRGGVRVGDGLWIPAGCVAVRCQSGDLVDDCGGTLAKKNVEVSPCPYHMPAKSRSERE